MTSTVPTTNNQQSPVRTATFHSAETREFKGWDNTFAASLHSRLDLHPVERGTRVLAHLRASAIAFFAVIATSAFALDFKPYGVGDFAKIVKAHTGKPLILHFWSITCPPCIAELPQWAKIITEKKDVDIVFVNTDDEDDRARALARLEKVGLTQATHYGFADGFVEKLYFEADKTWRGELPFTALVAPDGGVTTVTGAVDDTLIAKWLEKQGAK